MKWFTRAAPRTEPADPPAFAAPPPPRCVVEIILHGLVLHEQFCQRLSEHVTRVWLEVHAVCLLHPIRSQATELRHEPPIDLRQTLQQNA